MSGDEQIDIVDEQDRVIGAATRREMRARKLRHRAVYVLVFNENGQIFVHRRTATKDVYPSYCDVAVGGVVGRGESYDAAAQRELGEEIGLAAVPRQILSFAYEDDSNLVNGMVYSCTSDGPFRLQPEEIESGEWLDLDEVVERAQREPFCPDGIEALFRYLDRLASVQAQ